jgi:hypothetical protein
MSSEDEIEYISTKRIPPPQYTHQSSDSESQSDDDQDKPSGAECLSRCKNFAEVTGTDSALAMFFLQDTKWDLDRALNAYYRQTNQSSSKIVACMDMKQLDEDERFNTYSLNVLYIKLESIFNE